nr:reverse transcriptase domain-containing protein [Tanacetum cinerariifolium]
MVSFVYFWCMRTRSFSNLPVVSLPNPSTSNPKRRSRRRSKQHFILEESPIDTMADQRTMAELLRAPTEGYAEAIVVPPILAEQFELKHSLINDDFGPAWDRYKDLLCACPHHGSTKLHQLDTFYNALNSADQDSLNSTTCGNLSERLSSTPPPISVKAVEEICVTCGGAHPYYQCHAAGGNTFPELRDNIQGYVAAAVVNYNQGNSIYCPPGMANQTRPSGFAQPNVQNNQNLFSQPQGYNRGNNFNPEQSYQAPTQENQVVPLIKSEKVKRINEANMKAMQTQINNVKIKLRNEMKNSIQASMSNQTNELKNMMASFFQMNIASGSRSLPRNTVANPKGELKAITTRSGIVLDGPSVPIPPPFINPEEDECVEETLTDQDLAEDVFVPVAKFIFPADFVIIDYKSNPRVPLILGRPFLWTARALIDVHREEMILRDGDEILTLNMRHDTSSYSNQPQKESINLINVFNDSNLHPPLHVNPLSDSTTYSSSPNQLLEEFSNELTLIRFPPRNDDLQFNIKSDLKEIEYMLHHDSIKDIDSILYDSIDQSNLANLVDSMPEMFTDEHALDYSSPSLFDEYDDDFFEVESDTENVYDDHFDSKGEKIKESKLLIDELDLPCDFLLPFEYDSILSEDFSKVDALPSTNNKDKVFNPGILIQENLFEIITRVVQNKKLAISHASLMIEYFDPPFYELHFFKEVPMSKMLLSFSFENKEKLFKPEIHTFEKFHSSLISELSHQGCKVFKINQNLKSLMKIFLFSCGKDTHILDVSCLYFYPLDQFKYRGIGSS